MATRSQVTLAKPLGEVKPVGESVLAKSPNLEFATSYSYRSCMPYEIRFVKKIAVENPKIYINECCWGGDLVRNELLPSITGKFEDIQTEQEDWGWFIWFRQGPVHFAVDIFCDHPQKAEFLIHLTSRKKKFFFLDKVEDSSELENVRELVCSKLSAWGCTCAVKQIEI